MTSVMSITRKGFFEMKKFLALAGSSLASVAAFAEETSAAVDTTAVNTMLTGVKTSLSGWVTSAVPILGSIAGAFLLFWLGKVVFRVVKGWANKAG